MGEILFDIPEENSSLEYKLFPAGYLAGAAVGGLGTVVVGKHVYNSLQTAIEQHQRINPLKLEGEMAGGFLLPFACALLGAYLARKFK